MDLYTTLEICYERCERYLREMFPILLASATLAHQRRRCESPILDPLQTARQAVAVARVGHSRALVAALAAWYLRLWRGRCGKRGARSSTSLRGVPGGGAVYLDRSRRGRLQDRDRNAVQARRESLDRRAGADAIIALRCCKLSGRYEGFWERRAQRRVAA